MMVNGMIMESASVVDNVKANLGNLPIWAKYC